MWLSVPEESVGEMPPQLPLSCFSSQLLMPSSAGFSQLRVTCPSPGSAAGVGALAGAPVMSKVSVCETLLASVTV